MDVDAFLSEIRADPAYAEQIVHIQDIPASEAQYAPDSVVQSAGVAVLLPSLGIERLYRHQGAALEAIMAGRDVLIATGTASGKTACYALPILHLLQTDPDARVLLLYPTKALCQDQARKMTAALEHAGLDPRRAGVFDGDTPSDRRRQLRDTGRLLFSNPDMVHAALMPNHSRWADLLGNLRMVVLDELHVYNGIFGSNMAHLLTRLFRICSHYGSDPPRLVACSATLANPGELAEQLTGRPFDVFTEDTCPRGRRVFVLWNPPRQRATAHRSRRSANVEAHELMARLVAKGIPTITFSKAKMTAEMIHRYVTERLQEWGTAKAAKVTPYRGGYRPEDRRDIETRLFNGELLGVSTTPALELGIDVGGLDASIVVGYPGTLASFFQQAGRAGRRSRDCLMVLIGLDTSVNQYIMSHPDYLFDRCIEAAVIEPDNPFVATGHLRCATQEIPLQPDELPRFGPHTGMILRVLNDNLKVRCIDGAWYHAASEIPQHEVSLRSYADANVLIQDRESGEVIGEINRFDAEPIVHPEAIYMHRGDTYRVLDLDLARNLASVTRVETDYYTQPLGGTDVHHIDHQLRDRPFGNGHLYWGEVTAYFNTYAFEKIHFYSLDAISRHGLDLPTMVLETMAFWIVPPETMLEQARRRGLDAHAGLRGIGYATRMLLPLFVTCSTLDFSHTVGSANSPWQAVFVYERYPHGLGFTEKAYETMSAILPAVLDTVRDCPCEDGCPCCVGKPLRSQSTWNVERGEASIPDKASALFILRGLVEAEQPLDTPDQDALTEAPDAVEQRLEQMLRRRLERMREPQVFHPITPTAQVRTTVPSPHPDEDLATPDPAVRHRERGSFERDLHKRLAKKLALRGDDPMRPREPTPRGMSARHGNLRPTDFPGKPAPSPPIQTGDPIARLARKRKNQDKQ